MAETGKEMIQVARAALDKATNELGARVKVWVDKAQAASPEGLSPEDTKQLAVDLGGVTANLNAMGKDPANPLPPIEPVPAPPPGSNPAARANQPNPRNAPNQGIGERGVDPSIDPKSGLKR